TPVFHWVSRRLIRAEPRSPETAARHFRRVLRRVRLPTLMAPQVTQAEQQIGGVPCLILTPPEAVNTLLYIHGGGFVAGDPLTYRNMASRLARQLNARVVLPDYRKAPEHPFPAPNDDVLAVYRALLDDGVRPERLVVAGDSAGGSLALSLLLDARTHGLPQPAACGLLSPATDQNYRFGSHVRFDNVDPMLSAALIEQLQGAYVPDVRQRQDPRASPVYGDWHGCAPLAILVSSDECLYDQSLRLAARARRAGVSVTLRSEPGRIHVWPIFVPLLKESAPSLHWLGEQLSRRLPG
ncbi:MAG: alpha/beta hydrolase fold domain-containing protein, partial [Oceanococcaceae bacterium]